VSGQAPETERERRLGELAVRLLAHPSPEGPTTAELFLAELPADTPPDLIVPDDLDLFGSLARRREGQITGVEVILEGTRPVSDFLVAYERDLEAHGWRRFESFHRGPGGFAGGFHMGPTAVFVNEMAVSALWIAARHTEGGNTEIGLRYDRENAANMMSNLHQPEPRGWHLLPELRPPTGVRLQPQGASGGDGHWASEARAQTEMGVPELEAHFAKQLAAAGWRRVAGRADETTGWSSWDVPEPGNWHGILLVLASLPGLRSMSLRIDSLTDRGPGGWSSGIIASR